MMAKPMKTRELHYPKMQYLIKVNFPTGPVPDSSESNKGHAQADSFLLFWI